MVLVENMFAKKRKIEIKRVRKKTSSMGLEPTIFGLPQTTPPEADALSIRPQGHTTDFW